jgi:hypothetical protein
MNSSSSKSPFESFQESIHIVDAIILSASCSFDISNEKTAIFLLLPPSIEVQTFLAILRAKAVFHIAGLAAKIDKSQAL